jgi:hypothetical protein
MKFNVFIRWAEAAAAMEGEVKFGAVDATVHGALAQQYGVQGYPTIKTFVKGQVKDYQGRRGAPPPPPTPLSFPLRSVEAAALIEHAQLTPPPSCYRPRP